MRSISIRQFQQHFHKELASLPFQVTKHGKPYFNVTTINGVTTSVEPNVTTKEEVVERIQKQQPTLQLCEHGSMKDLCKFGYK